MKITDKEWIINEIKNSYKLGRKHRKDVTVYFFFLGLIIGAMIPIGYFFYYASLS